MEPPEDLDSSVDSVALGQHEPSASLPAIRSRRDWIAIVVSTLAVLVSFAFALVARNDEQALRLIEDHRRLRELVADFPSIQAAVVEGDVISLQAAQIKISEAVALADRLDARLSTAERAGMAVALLLISDAHTADEMLDDALDAATSVPDRVLVMRLKAQVALAFQDFEGARDYLDDALALATPESLGSQFLADDVNVITHILAFSMLSIVGDCDTAARHAAELSQILGRLGALAELLTFLPEPAKLQEALEACRET